MSGVTPAKWQATVFGTPLDANNRPQQQQPQHTPAANAGPSAPAGKSKDALVGPHWANEHSTFVFARDGSVWEWFNRPGRDWAKVINFGDEVAEVGGENIGKFTLSASKDKITRQSKWGTAEYQRQVVSPSPNIAGVVWSLEKNENSKITFHADGKFSREGPWEEKGTWINLGGGFYGVYHTNGDKRMYKINSDFTQLEHRWSHIDSEIFKRTTPLPPDATAAPVSIKHIFSNTKWRFGNADAYAIAFYPDGTYAQKIGTKISRGKWLVTNPTTIRTLSGNATFTIAADRQTIIQSANGKSYTWNNAGLPKVVTQPRPKQKTPPQRVAHQTQTPAEEFRILRTTEEQMIAKEMVNINYRDKGSLELLEKRVGISNIGLQEKIVEALRAVKESRDFGADAPDKSRKFSQHEKDFWGIKQNRDKRIQEMRRNIANRLKSSYQAIFRRAAAARDFKTAKEIQEMLKAGSFISVVEMPANSFDLFAGTWRADKGNATLTINSSGFAEVSWGQGRQLRRKGTRNIINPSGWELRLSANGETLIGVANQNLHPGVVWKKQVR
jgi:hypothetical protein